MENRTSAKECLSVYLLGTLIAFLMMRFGFGPASASMHERPEYDLNIYYLIGQAWMQGDVPYLIFADIKGPFVFLLHGLGAVLTPGSFLGACLLEAPLVGIGLLYAYRSARLFLPAAEALGVLGLYSVSILYFSLHPVELVWVLQHVALYYLLRWGVSGHSIRKERQFILGASAGIVLLVKFNLVAFWVPFCIWGVFANGRRWWMAGLLQLLGAVTVLLPFLAYFYLNEALGKCWQEYVLNAVAYGRTPWSGSALCTHGWRLAAEMIPLHLHQALPGTLAALVGWCYFIPCLLLPACFRGSKSAVVPLVLTVAFALLVVANYAGSRVFIHYSFCFSVFYLAGLVCVLRGRWLPWAGGAALLLVLGFALTLPHAVRHLKPDNGNKEMILATRKLTSIVSHGYPGCLVVLDVENALHLHRLCGAQLRARHFIPAMVPGGYEEHRSEMETLIYKAEPLFVVGSVRTAKADAELLRNTHVKYRACSLSELGLPGFPAHAKHPEFILYVRNE